jgi:hypothetical protein
MATLMKNYAKSLGLYFVFINLGVFLSLILLSVIGYLPYSDRPGPGWQGSHFSFHETWFFLTWSISFAPYSIVYGTGVYLLSQLLRRIRISYFIRAALTGLASGFVSMYLVAGSGWIIAIAGPPVYISGCLGLVYGAWILPKYLGKDLQGTPFSRRERLVVPTSLLLFIGLIYFSFFYKPYSQDFDINVIAPQDSIIDLSSDDWLTGIEKAVLQSKGLNRKYKVGFQSLFSQGGNSEKSRVLIVIQKGKENSATLPQPKNSNVVFIEEKGSWAMYPSNAQVLKKKIFLKQLDNDSNQWKIQVEPKKEDIFQWKPTED